jgi:hypothetical protein
VLAFQVGQPKVFGFSFLLLEIINKFVICTFLFPAYESFFLFFYLSESAFIFKKVHITNLIYYFQQ